MGQGYDNATSPPRSFLGGVFHYFERLKRLVNFHGEADLKALGLLLRRVFRAGVIVFIDWGLVKFSLVIRLYAPDQDWAMIFSSPAMQVSYVDRGCPQSQTLDGWSHHG